MTPEKTVNPRMYQNLIAQLLTNQPELASLDFEAMRVAIGKSDLNRAFGEWINNGCTIQVVAPIEGADSKPVIPVAPKVPKTFTFEVDYDDPAYQLEIVKEDWLYVDNGITRKHFPTRKTGKATITAEYVEFDHQPTTQEPIDAFKAKNLDRMDWAETMAFHRAFPNERLEAPVVSLCGEFKDRGAARYVACVYAFDAGVYLRFYRPRHPWIRRCRFPGVRKSA